MTGQIVIPDDSPFTPEQRVWLSGYLEKLLAGGSRSNCRPDRAGDDPFRLPNR